MQDWYSLHSLLLWHLLVRLSVKVDDRSPAWQAGTELKQPLSAADRRVLHHAAVQADQWQLVASQRC